MARFGPQIEIPDGPQPTLPLAVRGMIALSVLVLIGIVWVANGFLTERFSQTTNARAELRQSLYAGAILSELQKNSVVPPLLAQDPTLLDALRARNLSAASERLDGLVNEIGSDTIALLNMDGRVVASTAQEDIGENALESPFFQEALKTSGTVFTLSPGPEGYQASFSRVLRDGVEPLGLMKVEVDLAQFETRWRGTTAAVLVTDANGVIIISTLPQWRGKLLEDALEELSPPSALNRALRGIGALGGGQADPGLNSSATLRLETRVPFRGWQLVSFTSYETVRDRVNFAIAIIITVFALSMALFFYLMNRRANRRSFLFQRESLALRQLNERLSREIAERQRVQEELRETEQSLAQSSKLAALGEMSAAVSHELNQPLAAMKTYLAGAKLLLQRKRVDEAASSFQRIDDLIERMGAITRQLKSYARKGDQAFEVFDMRDAVIGALTLMEPQLRQEDIKLSHAAPPVPVWIEADRLRLEQVIINLVRNALDAMRGREVRELELLLTVGQEVSLSVRDTGHGIEDMDALFEPFYTTKAPNEGVGLGLAISSTILKDLGGRLTARNSAKGGAVFEVRLPRRADNVDAAE